MKGYFSIFLLVAIFILALLSIKVNADDCNKSCPYRKQFPNPSPEPKAPKVVPAPSPTPSSNQDDGDQDNDTEYVYRIG